MTELETTNFKVNSDGRKIKEFTGYIKGEKIKIKCKVNKEGDIREYVSGVPEELIGEQLFTYNALCRLGVEKRLPSFEDIKEIEDINLAGYWSPYYEKFYDIREQSIVWLAGGNNAYFYQNKWYRYDNNRYYGFSGRLLKAELTAVNGVDELVKKYTKIKTRLSLHPLIGISHLDMFIEDLQALKLTSVAKEDIGEMGKHIMLQPGEYYKDEFGNIITYEDEQKETLKDSQPKVLEIKKIYRYTNNDGEEFYNGLCKYCGRFPHWGDNYCSGCGSKINWIA